MNPGTIRSCYMYTKESVRSESRYNKVVLHEISDHRNPGTIRSCYMYTKDSQWS